MVTIVLHLTVLLKKLNKMFTLILGTASNSFVLNQCKIMTISEGLKKNDFKKCNTYLFLFVKKVLTFNIFSI